MIDLGHSKFANLFQGLDPTNGTAPANARYPVKVYPVVDVHHDSDAAILAAAKRNVGEDGTARCEMTVYQNSDLIPGSKFRDQAPTTT